MSELRVVKEEFNGLYNLVNTLEKRPNNRIMKDETSSQDRGSESFYGTDSYEEAVTLLKEGYTDILEQVKDKVSKLDKKIMSSLLINPKNRPKNSVIGYTPHVPNAIIGLPESMIDTTKIKQKQKTIDIVYVMGANCSQDKQLFIDAGIILLGAIKILEINKISVKLQLGFMPSEVCGELTCPTVLLKNYAQRLDLQKLCFPLAHPAMFRRIGFKWLETNPDIKGDFTCGYGRSPIHDESDLESFIQKFKPGSNQKIITAQKIRALGFDVQQVLNYLNII